MRIFVAGAAGVVGRLLLPKLVHENQEVIVLGAPVPAVQLGSERWERGALNAKARLEFGWKPLYPTWRSGFAQSLA